MNFLLVRRYSLLALLYCSLFTVFGLAGFHAIDGDHVSVMAVLLENGGQPDRFFALPILIFSIFKGVGVSADSLATLWGLVLTYFMFRRVDSFRLFGFCMVAYSPAPMMYLGIASKELFLITFLMFFLWGVDLGRRKLSVAVMVLYSLLFRMYILFFVAGYVLRQLRPFYVFVLSLASVFLFLLFYDEFLASVSDVIYRRDVFYDLRSDVVRSTWFNPSSEEGWCGVLYNYLYAFFRINFPVFFFWGMKEIYLQFYVVFSFLSVFVCFLVSRDSSRWVCVGVFLMYILYPFIEPDLGSYLRHLSSWFPITVWCLFRVFGAGKLVVWSDR